MTNEQLIEDSSFILTKTSFAEGDHHGIILRAGCFNHTDESAEVFRRTAFELLVNFSSPSGPATLIVDESKDGLFTICQTFNWDKMAYDFKILEFQFEYKEEGVTRKVRYLISPLHREWTVELFSSVILDGMNRILADLGFPVLE